MSTVIKRAVGYCETIGCDDYTKGVFLLNHGDTFLCPVCRMIGHMEKERGYHTGEAKVFRETRVEFNYDPITGVYRDIAIVRDESLWGPANVYTLHSPLIRAESRALRVAEALLCNLNKMNELPGEDVPRSNETLLSFDVPKAAFQVQLQLLQSELERIAAHGRPA